MTCGCNNGRSFDCGNIVVATAHGSACCEEACPEDHCQKIYIDQFYASVRTDLAWNIPACGSNAVVVINNLKAIVVGSYLWNPTYGYFEVAAFDVTSGEVTLTNNCQDGNAAVGTQVPECTEFVVCDPPSTEVGGIASFYPYLAEDFTAPPADPDPTHCITITVTSIAGLSVGKLIVIGDGTYTLDSIVDGYHIVICNDGLGTTPLTVVRARDGAGNLQYPVITIDANVCSNVGVSTGALLCCHTGAAQILDSTEIGAIPICTDATSNECEMVNPCSETPASSGSILICSAGAIVPLDATATEQIPVVTDATANLVEMVGEQESNRFTDWVDYTVQIIAGTGESIASRPLSRWRWAGKDTIELQLDVVVACGVMTAISTSFSLPAGLVPDSVAGFQHLGSAVFFDANPSTSTYVDYATNGGTGSIFPLAAMAKLLGASFAVAEIMISGFIKVTLP